MFLGISGLLQPLFFKPFCNVLNYNNNRNTYEHIVLFTGIIDDIMETYMNNMEGNIIRIICKYYTNKSHKNKFTNMEILR